VLAALFSLRCKRSVHQRESRIQHRKTYEDTVFHNTNGDQFPFETILRKMLNDYKKNFAFIYVLLKIPKNMPLYIGEWGWHKRMKFRPFAIRGISIFAALITLGGCDSLQGIGDTVSGWGNSIAETVVSVNPLGAEAIAVGRATPLIAGNTFASAGDRGVRLNFSYDFRLAGKRDGSIDGKPTLSWLFVDRRLENAETYLQFHRVDGEGLEGFGDGESFFLDRTEITAQLHCVGISTKEISPLVSDYIEFVREEGFPVPREYLMRRMTEKSEREGLGHRVDVVYIEDILRSGYTCEDLGNLLLPSSDAIRIYLEAYKKRSERSFAVVG